MVLVNWTFLVIIKISLHLPYRVDFYIYSLLHHRLVIYTVELQNLTLFQFCKICFPFILWFWCYGIAYSVHVHWSFLLQDGESGWSSLHGALHFRHIAVANILLQSGAFIMLEDSKFRTPVDLLSGLVSQVIGSERDSGTRWFLESLCCCYVYNSGRKWRIHFFFFQ